MKPRIEKKLSKALVAIFEGTSEFGSVWIDDQYYRHQLYPSEFGGKLKPSQIRYNLQRRVSVNHMPSIGGEADYWGEGTDYHSVHHTYDNGLWALCLYTDELCRVDCLTPRPQEGTPEHAEWEAQKAALLAKADRDYRRIRPGNRLLAHAREEAAVLRFKESIQADRLAASKARWAAERAARKATA